MSRMFVWIFSLLVLVSCEKQVDTVVIDKEVILVRKIGHEIMKYARDSTTSLRPIIELGDRNYLIEFNTDFAFVSDSIINIIDREVRAQSKSEYVVKVHTCEDADLVFSYFISPEENKDLVSCMGRSQEKACYKVEIAFIDEPMQNGYEGLWLLLALPLIGVFIYLQFKKPPSEPNYEIQPQDGIRIGKYHFFFDSQTIEIEGVAESLTYKESKILKVLGERINEVVDRDELQKQVWEDDGIVVGRSLDMFISKLRKKLNADENVQIKNIHGIGYKLMVS